MRRRFVVPLTLSLLCACAYDATGESNAELVVTDRCDISGLGLLAPDGDFLAGRAHGADTGASGDWIHVGDGHVVVADAEFILCRINGAILGDFGGPATFDGRSGYSYRVAVQDFGDPGPPEVLEGTPEIQTVSARRTYRPSRWEDGALTIEDRARVTIPSELPVTVGNAGNRWAWIRFQRSQTYDVVTCRYRGGASRPNPWRPGGLAGGERYLFERCVGELGEPVEAGDRVDVRWMELHVHTGAHTQPSRRAAETEVTVDFEVTPLILRERPRDRYTIAVFDDAAGVRVYFREGELAVGNISVVQLDP